MIKTGMNIFIREQIFPHSERRVGVSLHIRDPHINNEVYQKEYPLTDKEAKNLYDSLKRYLDKKDNMNSRIP